MHRPLRTRHARLLLAALAAAGLTVAGCGSDGNAASTTAAPTTSAAAAATTTAAAATTAAPATSKAPTTTKATTSTAAATTPAGSTPAAGAASDDYCDAAMAINTAGTAAGDPDEDPAAFAKQLLGPAKAAAALAPAEIAAAYATAIPAMQAAIDGDSSKFGDIDQAGAQIDEFNAANCPWTKVPVTMADYHFVGLPETLKAGDYTFELDNTGTESHLLLIITKKPGVTESFEELLASPEGESKVDTVVAGFAPPGGQAKTSGHLDPGDYLVLCPISVGSTGQTEGTGPPHFTMGMQQALTVS